ncbi:hypothetical protein [Dactylosporangium sp. CA-139066]|uniref:hypothetical protein n=1 Tax=Dactylosporangium sp. CA-139066 TaxID=3239930 RepID=UPI003D90BF45
MSDVLQSRPARQVMAISPVRRPRRAGPRHALHRATWLCGGCGDPWPCTLRRTELLAKYRDNPGELHRMMDFYAQLAATSAPDANLAAALQSQIADWVPQRTATQPDCGHVARIL